MAAKLIANRNPTIGVSTVRGWATSLAAGASILDLGCGHGFPISTALAEDGFDVFGIDASPELVAEFRRQLPGASVCCEAVETSSFFDRRFDAAIAIGLIFLLREDIQRRLICRVATALTPGGRFLFTAPAQDTSWKDMLTGRQSRSLGMDAYLNILRDADLELLGEFTDEGENHTTAQEGSCRTPTK